MDRTIRPLGWIRSANSPSCSPGPSTSRIRDNSTTNKENRDKTPTSRATPTHAPRLALQTVDTNSDILRPSLRATPKRPISTSTPKSQGVQSKLSSFFVQPQPQPQPRSRPRPSQHATPTPKRARIQPNTPVVSFDDDQQVHQRAQQLLRSGRFGSVPRSVPSSTPNTSTPTLRSSPPPQASDVEEEMSPAPARVIKPNPPTRPARPPPVPAPPSSDPEDEPEPDESLASLGPFSWQIRAAPLMAEYKRRAGLSESQIFTHQRERMQAQVASAHERLLGTNTRSHITPRRQPPAPVPAPAPAQTTPSRTFKPLSQQTPPLEPPKPVSRSPKSKRRIYALETQARPSHPRSSQESLVLQLAPQPRPRPPNDSDETQPLAWDRDGDEEEEDETQPLAWDDESESEAEAEDDELVVAETQGAEREPSGKDRDGQVASHEPSSSTHHPNPVTLSSPSGTGRFDAVLCALRHTTQAATCTSPTATDKQANLHRFGFASGYGHCRASGPGSAVPLGADLQDELSDDDDDETQPLSLPLPEPDSETLPLSQELRIPPSSASSADWVPGESMRSADDAAVRFIRDL